ncbi:MAG: glycosyltransferase family 2 protein [Candidatus Hodarchaeales archaeon]|jgi:glycosyltransferase involved in cell wall biosynthesis
MDKEEPMTSIIVPTFNRGHIIKKTIRCIIKQTYQNFELIIVDDGSSDNTKQVVNKFNDSRIRYIKRQVNSGGSIARNIGIKEARGEYIAFNDSDDIWLPNKLEMQMKIFDSSSKKVGVVYCDWAYIKGKKTYMHKNIKKKRREGDIYGEIDNFYFTIPTSTVILKKKCLEKSGVFDERFRAQEDYDLWIRLSKYYHFKYVKNPLVILQHSGRYRSAQVKSNFLLLEKYPHLFMRNKIFRFDFYYQIGKLFFFKKNKKRRIWQNHLRYAVRINPFNLYSIKIFLLYFSRYFLNEKEIYELYHILTNKITNSHILWILRG